jgi:hypothetical protein
VTRKKGKYGYHMCKAKHHTTPHHTTLMPYETAPFIQKEENLTIMYACIWTRNKMSRQAVMAHNQRRLSRASASSYRKQIDQGITLLVVAAAFLELPDQDPSRTVFCTDQEPWHRRWRWKVGYNLSDLVVKP